MPKASKTTVLIQKANHGRLPPATAATALSAAATMSTCESWGNPTPNLPYDLEWEDPARVNVSSASSRAAGRNSRSSTTGLRPTLAFAPYPPPTNLAFPSGYMETINLGAQGWANPVSGPPAPAGIHRNFERIHPSPRPLPVNEMFQYRAGTDIMTIGNDPAQSIGRLPPSMGQRFKQYPPDFTHIPVTGYNIDSSNNTHLMGQDETVPPAEQRTIVLEECSLSQLRDLKKNGGSSGSDANEYAPPTRGRKKPGERCLKCRDNHNGCIGNVGECCR
ncbi:hypothetical protein OBBRIDRAFT_412722 [Obba rivulosa]|uniref:Uncharacterized protein n=1 Tax=Obba rivulosa TaxID=1052685 RepID=A0A8E2ALC3_9APHY|nr:hypothetical protein OBBRIDRAFT_412722 [Obba rivulosa]